MIMRMKTGLLQSIIKKVIVILPFYLFTFLPLTAQTFTQNIQKTKTGEGTITIHQDTAIDELVNGPVPTVKQKPTIKKTTPVKPTSRDNKKDTHVTQEIKDTIERKPLSWRRGLRTLLFSTVDLPFGELSHL